jgi:hypothetical protein
LLHPILNGQADLLNPSRWHYRLPPMAPLPCLLVDFGPKKLS